MKCPPNSHMILSTLKGNNKCAAPSNSTTGPHLYLRCCPIAALLLWWHHQPLLASRRWRIDRRQDCSVDTIEIGSEDGELSCFSVFDAARYPSQILMFRHNQIALNSRSLQIAMARCQTHQICQYCKRKGKLLCLYYANVCKIVHASAHSFAFHTDREKRQQPVTVKDQVFTAILLLQ